MDEDGQANPHELLARVKRAGFRRRAAVMGSMLVVLAALVAVPLTLLGGSGGQSVRTTPAGPGATSTTLGAPSVVVQGDTVRGATVDVVVRGVPSGVNEVDVEMATTDHFASVGVGTGTVTSGVARVPVTVVGSLVHVGACPTAANCDLVDTEVGRDYVITAKARPGGSTLASTVITIVAATPGERYRTHMLCGGVDLDGAWDLLGAGRDGEQIRDGTFVIASDRSSGTFTDRTGKRFDLQPHQGPVSDKVCPSSGDASEATGVPLSSVEWESLQYPVDCGGQTTGSAVAFPEPEPGAQVAVVFVTCVAGAGSPPSAVLVYDHADSANSAHLAQTLLPYEDNWIPEKDATTASGTKLTISVYGYSTESVPRCCPDIHTNLTWNWSSGEYVAAGPEPSHTRLPAR